MAESKSDSSSNLQRRYRRLFRLPGLRTSVVSASIVAILVEIVSGFALHSSPITITVYAIITEAVLLLTLEIDLKALKRKSGIATYRRLSAISILSNLVWLCLSLVGLIVSMATVSEGKFIALAIIGAFFAMAFRAFVFGSVFYGKTLNALPISLVQPILLAIPVFNFYNVLSAVNLQIWIALAGGMLYLGAMEVYLYSINRGTMVAGHNPLQLLQSFLSAWALEDATKMEDLLQDVSKQNIVSTEMLELKIAGSSALIIVPGIHPGPFYPVGSSNLPYAIYSAFHSEKMIPMTVHSISDHELNLPSRIEVEKYLSSLSEAVEMDQGNKISEPSIKKSGKATATAIAFGSTCLVALTLAPNGMEDFPVSVRKDIESRASRAGFNLCLVIDTHNSEGPKPSEKECEDVVSAANEAIEEIRNSTRHDFCVGFSHSSELNTSLPRDVGPAGIGVISLDKRRCLVVADANNSKLGFREQVFSEFEKRSGSRILELCTSDTHVTAARAKRAKGYVALGDLISANDFTSLLCSLFEKAETRIDKASFSARRVKSEVRTIGGESLDEFSLVMDRASRRARKGAKILVAMGIIIPLLAIL